MSITNVEEVVKERFAEIMNVPPAILDVDADLASEYGVDSLKALKLISQVEVEFDVDIEEQEAQGIKKLNDVIELIKGKLG
jgi:acyl carrier protein